MNDIEYNILINEVNIPIELMGLLRFKSFAEIRTGIYNLIERLELLYPNANIFYNHENAIFLSLFLDRNPKIKEYSGEKINLEFSPSNEYFPWNQVRNIQKQLLDDYMLFNKHNNWSGFQLNEKIHVIGDKDKLHIHSSANILPGVIFDLTEGPIIINANCFVYPHSYIKGPVYLAEKVQIVNGRIERGCIFGEQCKISGGISGTLFGNFSNKAHEGSITNSHIGDWVNIAALTSTNNFYNYESRIKIQLEKESFTEIDYKEFGAIICDFSRVSGAVLLESGTLIDFGSILWVNKASGYYPTFSYFDKKRKYNFDEFIEHSSKMVKRRNKSLSFQQKSYLKEMYLQS